MNSGRYLWAISAERHAEATMNQLGWQSNTRGSVVHALQPRLTQIWPIGYITNTINANRKAQWVAEEKAKA